MQPLTTRTTLASLAIMVSTAVTVLDIGLVNMALPTLAAEFGVREARVVWVATVFQVTGAALLLAASGLSYRVGLKRLFAVGIWLFTAGAAVAATATEFNQLLAGRAIQGVGSAAILSIAPALLRHIFPPEKLGRALALNALIVGGGLAVGPILGGLVLHALSWHWVFAVNIPLGVIGIWSTHRALNEAPRAQKAFDWSGAVLSVVMIAGLFLALQQVSARQAGITAVSLVLMSVAAGALFVRRQQHANFPLLPLTVFSNPILSAGLSLTLMAFTLQGLIFVTLTFYYQTYMGYSPLATALWFAAWPATLLIAGPLAGQMADRMPTLKLLAAGLVLLALGVVMMGLGMQSDRLPLLIIGSCVAGAGFGAFQVPNNHEVMSSVPLGLSSSASGLLATVRTLGQGLGTALFGVLWILAGGSLNGAIITAAVLSVLAALTGIARVINERQ